MEKYQCQICNKLHAVYFSSKGGIPRNVLEIRMNEETNRIEELSEYLLVVDEKDVYVKGIVRIETTFTENPITHEAWILIPLKEYEKQIEDLKGKPDLVLHGVIASELPFYPELNGLKAIWKMDKQNQIGYIIALSDSNLKNDQLSPIAEKRIEQMMEFIHHPELHKENKTFHESFEERIKKSIKQSKTEFHLKDRLFLIDISNMKEVLLQLIPGKLINLKPKKDIGIHLSNDTINENYEHVKEEMSKMCLDQDFNEIVLDGIETYQKNYHFNDLGLISDVTQILESIFHEDVECLDIQLSEA